MSDQTFERATLDGKDREQLQAIASAVGIKGVSRMKKADLVDAIIGSAPGGDTPAPPAATTPAPAPAPAPLPASMSSIPTPSTNGDDADALRKEIERMKGEFLIERRTLVKEVKKLRAERSDLCARLGIPVPE